MNFRLALVVLGLAIGFTSCRPKPAAPAAESRHEAPSPADPKAGGVVLHRAGAAERSNPLTSAETAPPPLRQGESMIVSFPHPMVAPADFDRVVTAPPVAFAPDLPLIFRWKSATEGEVIVQGPPAPATAYRLGLREGLQNLEGEPVRVPAWGLVWAPAPFRAHLTHGASHADTLPARPELGLRFSHPVAAAEVARTALWRDDRGHTIRSEVQLPATADAASSLHFTLAPLAPLEPGRAYELLVEGTVCALDGSRLPYVHVFPLGRTHALVVEWVRALHQPQRGTFLEIRFNQPLDEKSPLAAAAVLRVAPSVRISRMERVGPDLRAFGEFMPGVRYAVEIAPGAVVSRRGFTLLQASEWRATFGAKRSAVILARSIFTTPAMRGLGVEFVQVNTGPLHWQLARVPAEHVLAVRQRLDEYRAFDPDRRDPRTGEFLLRPTTLLVPDLPLPVLASGAFEASGGNREVPRALAFAPEQVTGGVYLLEISGLAIDGRVVGNRALILVNREFLVWKNEDTGLRARLFDLASGDPVADAGLRLLAGDGGLLAAGTTDAAGEFVTGKWEEHHWPEVVLVNRAGASSAHLAEFTGHLPWYRESSDRREWSQWLFTDRGLYRPGETVHVKGIVRAVAGGQLALPDAGAPIRWELRRHADDDPVLTGETSLSATGAWEAEIVLPATLPLGGYALTALGRRCDLKVDEFRALAFAVELHSSELGEDQASRVRVLSHYFHGAPNARALVRWRAVWSPHWPVAKHAEGDRYLSTSDYVSPELELHPPSWARAASDASESDAEARSITRDGTAVLDADGVAELQSASPFPPGARLGGAQVSWEISVIAPDGQTVGAAGGQIVPLARAHPAVSLAAGAHPGEIELVATGVDSSGEAVAGVPLLVTLHHVVEKSVREIVSSHVVRYRNTPLATRVLTRQVVAPFRETLSVAATGRYVAVVELAGMAAPPRASDETTVTGRDPAEFAQWDDRSFVIQSNRESYVAGDVAHLTVRAPFTGRAWVTVETDRVLTSTLVDLAGNAATVEVPVTAAMHPNAYVQVYLFRPGDHGEPAERMGSCELRVRRPETELQIVTELAAPKVEPGETVRGTVTVSTAGGPAADAELTLFAVDEAILRYGRWALPDPAADFFPARGHGVWTTSGLGQFKSTGEDPPLFQKGFLLGDGSLGWRSRFVRSRFLALAFWQGSVRTDAAGRASFAFPAPDNLTDYRIVAVAQHGREAFGSGSQHVQVARRLQAEPALPRFVRAGDEVELRAILRQGAWPELAVNVTCAVEGATLAGVASEEKTLARALPQAAVFRARVAADATRLRVRFAAHATGDPGVADAVEIELPVRPATTLRRETLAGDLPAAGWSPAAALPPAWREGQGTVDLMVSSSPWLPLFAGLPGLLDYPHGCVEQVSGRVLAYALMGDLLRTLPDGGARAPEYRRRVEEGIARLVRAQLPDGALPYWPGGTTAHPFATIQTAWAVVEAQRSGWKVSETATGKLHGALLRILRRQDGVRVAPPLRAFALMVASALEVQPAPRVEALELYQQRDALGDDGRAFLALALHGYGVLPDEMRQLVAELEREPAERAFEPATFGSSARTAALRLCARATVAGRAWTDDERASQRRALTALQASSQNFSTQESLWLLLAFRALARSEGTAPATAWELPYPGGVRSADGRAAGWPVLPLADFSATFGAPAQCGGGTGSYLLRATYRLPAPEARVDRGFRVERVVRNLTAPARDGSGARPFQLGDELAVTFRVLTERAQAYVALEESLPAAFETVDPDYYRATQRERLATLGVDGGLPLSHWEKRDDRTLWYFDTMAAGAGSYTTIVRVTSAGRFHWPGVAIAPMYDARFSGLSEGATIEVR